jgi:hypothetical protein
MKRMTEAGSKSIEIDISIGRLAPLHRFVLHKAMMPSVFPFPSIVLFIESREDVPKQPLRTMSPVTMAHTEISERALGTSKKTAAYHTDRRSRTHAMWNSAVIHCSVPSLGVPCSCCL